MSQEFIDNFMEFVDKIPSVKEGEFYYLSFSIVYEKEGPGKRNVLMTGYKIPGAMLEIFLQSPKETALEGVDENKLLSVNIDGKKYYTDYNPNLEDFVIMKGNFYTIVKDYVLTVLSPDKNFLKLVEPERSMKFQKDIVSYAKKFTKDIDDFSLCMVIWTKEDKLERSRLILFNVVDQTEIMVDVFKADKEEIKTFWGNIKGKKKLEGTLYTGKLDDENVVCSILDDQRVLAAKCTRGKEELLPKLTRRVMKVIK